MDYRALIGTAWSEGSLIKLASAIEDLQRSVDTPWKRTLPSWRDHEQRNIPVFDNPR